MIDENLFKKLSFFIVLAVLAILSVILIWPIASAIVSGLILSYIFYPLYKKIIFFVKEKNVSAVIVILMVMLIIFLPLWFILPLLAKQTFDIYLYVQHIDIFSLIKYLLPNLAEANFSKDFVTSMNTFILNMFSKIFASASSLVLSLPSIMLKLAIITVVFFFGMRDAEILIKYVASLSPFSKEVEKEFAKKFSGITFSVIYGYFIVGFLQGLLTGLALFIFGVPHWIVLTLIAMFAAIIPVLGAWIVWIPTVVYLFASGRIISATILLLYSALFVSWVDNIIRSYIVAKKTQLSSGIVIIGMIGGIIVFGILGLIIGPLILAYLLLILDAYRNRKMPSLFSPNSKV